MTENKPPSEDRTRLPQLPAKIEAGDVVIGAEKTRPLEIALRINEALPGLVRHEPTALLLDINNLYRRSKDNGFSIDYDKLKNVFEQRCDLRYCAAFSAVDRNNPQSTKWVEYMQNKGYSLVIKDLKRYTNARGDTVSKGNMDIEITIAALELSAAFAHVIIGTCDGDFVPLVDKLREGNFRKVSVLGITNANWTGMSDTLVRSADHFYDLAAIREHIEYTRDRHG